MRRPLAALLLLVGGARAAQAFEWDDGRGVLPYKFSTTRHYVAAGDLEHMRQFRDPDGGGVGASLTKQFRARAPRKTGAGPGEATAQFHIDETGRVDSLNIVSASSPAHAQIARAIVSGVRTPPPAGGGYTGMQQFRFH